ncbi:Protein of unknown function [Micromonospora lupini str. Lupac 08]|uniref:Uncharacterized protein n=1 Tax=Micromonospora lupini str. Lupac 08 TaxID=1150864 RepID=I0KWK6_9ACTN|nr:Protein of unknown function [Micromonospora lupini str. Lupac 08]
MPGGLTAGHGAAGRRPRPTRTLAGVRLKASKLDQVMKNRFPGLSLTYFSSRDHRAPSGPWAAAGGETALLASDLGCFGRMMG